MARPKKPAGESRAKLMQVRVRPHEYETFQKAARTTGLDLSSWVRQQLVLAARRDLKRYG